MVNTPSELAKELIEVAKRGDPSELHQLHAKSPERFEEACLTKDFLWGFTDLITDFSPEIIDEFVGLNVDLNRHENSGYAPDGAFPLGNCVLRGKYDRAKFLLQLGADPNACFALNTVSYMRANAEAQIAMAQLLIDFGADVNQESKNIPGYTPLCRAIDKGHQELADFLIAKGAVMPRPPDVEQRELNLNTFQARLEAACRDCWNAVRAQYPNEHFCLFGLESDSDFVIVNPLFDSEGAIERNDRERRPGNSFVARVSLDSDAEFYGQGKEYFDDLSSELNSRYGVGESRRERTNRIKLLLTMFESALKNLDREGLFGTGPDRERIILLVSIIDADRAEWSTMLKIAKRLNPAVVFKQFKRSLS